MSSVSVAVGRSEVRVQLQTLRQQKQKATHLLSLILMSVLLDHIITASFLLMLLSLNHSSLHLLQGKAVVLT